MPKNRLQPVWTGFLAVFFGSVRSVGVLGHPATATGCRSVQIGLKNRTRPDLHTLHVMSKGWARNNSNNFAFLQVTQCYNTHQCHKTTSTWTTTANSDGDEPHHHTPPATWNEKAQDTSTLLMCLGPDVCFFFHIFHFTNETFRYLFEL